MRLLNVIVALTLSITIQNKSFAQNNDAMALSLASSQKKYLFKQGEVFEVLPNNSQVRISQTETKKLANEFNQAYEAKVQDYANIFVLSKTNRPNPLQKVELLNLFENAPSYFNLRHPDSVIAEIVHTAKTTQKNNQNSGKTGFKNEVVTTDTKHNN